MSNQQPVTKDVLIGLPIYDNRIEADILQECLAAVQDPTCVVAGIQYYNGDSLIPRGRNKIAKMFLDSPHKYLMFIDSDIRFHRAHINRLRSHDKGIVGGVYLKKKIPYAPVMNSRIGQEGELYVMQEIGTGFMMIRRDVFGAFRSFWPEHDYTNDSDEAKGTYHDWFRVGVKNGRYLSEDYYFCQLAGQLGIKTYLDPQIMTHHIGKMAYPMPDDTFVEGAAHLLENVIPSAPLNVETLERLANASAKQLEQRKPKPVDAPVIPTAKRYVQTNTTDTVASEARAEAVL